MPDRTLGHIARCTIDLKNLHIKKPKKLQRSKEDLEKSHLGIDLWTIVIFFSSFPCLNSSLYLSLFPPPNPNPLSNQVPGLISTLPLSPSPSPTLRWILHALIEPLISSSLSPPLFSPPILYLMVEVTEWQKACVTGEIVGEGKRETRGERNKTTE
jgi:hypothetical protein